MKLEKKKKSVDKPHTPTFLDMLFSKIAFIPNAVLNLLFKKIAGGGPPDPPGPAAPSYE